MSEVINIKADQPVRQLTPVRALSPSGASDIRPSKSPYAVPFFFIKKKDGKLRLVQDYRRINKWTIRNQYPLPLIPQLINKVRSRVLFTKFDIRWGYNNVRIKQGDEWKAAFITNEGLFEPTVMFFGDRKSVV